MAKGNTLLVLGAGSWGTALAIQAARVNAKVRLWGHSPDKIKRIEQTRYNETYLPGYAISDNISCHDDLATACAGVNDILIAVPSHAFRETLAKLTKVVAGDAVRLVVATKGFDPEKRQLLSQTIKEFFPKASAVAFLAGPSFALELAQGLPTAVALSAEKLETAESLRKLFHGGTFRVYTNDDVVGTQVGGAVKNVMAIAAGIADGLGFGANTRAALITRGLHEITRFAKKLGAHDATLMGLTGMGDLILTCTDNQSRNRRFGLALGQGLSCDEAIAQIGQVVEGKEAAGLIQAWSAELSLDMPIVDHVANIIACEMSPKEAVLSLLSRSPTIERI